MPIYEYNCSHCGKFEVLQKITESDYTECPNCAKNGVVVAVEKVVSLSAFHLKGKGWYKTDYASSSSADSSLSKKVSKETSTESKSDSETVKPTSTKTDTSTSKTSETPTPTT